MPKPTKRPLICSDNEEDLDEDVIDSGELSDSADSDYQFPNTYVKKKKNARRSSVGNHRAEAAGSRPPRKRGRPSKNAVNGEAPGSRMGLVDRKNVQDHVQVGNQQVGGVQGNHYRLAPQAGHTRREAQAQREAAKDLEIERLKKENLAMRTTLEKIGRLSGALVEDSRAWDNEMRALLARRQRQDPAPMPVRSAPQVPESMPAQILDQDPPPMALLPQDDAQADGDFGNLFGNGSFENGSNGNEHNEDGHHGQGSSGNN